METINYDRNTQVVIVPLQYRLNPVLNEMMTSDETAWLNDYHQTVYEKLASYLSDEEKEWLKRKTKPVQNIAFVL